MFPVLEYDTLGSTNDEARRLIAAQQVLGGRLAIRARRQTSGRGRLGNSWQSLEGNLFLTLIERVSWPQSLSGQMSFVTAVAVAETLRPLVHAPERLSLKWPNDIFYGNSKAGGILIEGESAGTGVNPSPSPNARALSGQSAADTGESAFLIIGIGLNLRAAPEGAALLLAIPGNPQTFLAPEDLVAPLGQNFLFWLKRWQAEGFAPVREEWLRQARGLGQQIRVRLPAESFEACFEGLDHDGRLLARLADGTVRPVLAGEVFLLENDDRRDTAEKG